MNKPKKCPGKDSFERMNYLYQASNTLATQNRSSHVASIHYTNLLVAVSKKTVQRLDINLKRTLCKGCHSLLLAGITAKVRIKKKKVQWKCLQCITVKSFDVSGKNNQPWTQKEESTVEVIDYGRQCL